MNPFVDPLRPLIARVLPRVEALYKDFHQHPELSHQEARTGAVAAACLRDAGYRVVEQVGGTGVVGLLENGAGPTVMVRADMDALPIREQTGLAYAAACEGLNAKGEPVPVSHACGHDMHLAWALGAAQVLAGARDAWRGTVLVVLQPAEETGTGSQAMLDDGLVARFPRPDVIFGQHLLQYRAGTVACKAGQLLTAGDSLQVRFFGAGGHGGMPQNAIDPIVMASAAVLRLQALVAREVAPQAQAVVTVGEFHAGHAENIIPAEAVIKLNVRTTDLAVREHLLAAIRRVCIAEARASNAPRDPEFEPINNFPLTLNDAEVTRRVAEAFRAQFGDLLSEARPVGASEDFGRFGQAWGTPYCYWFVGGTSPEAYDAAAREGTLDALPGPHSPYWAPALDPTLRTGIETLLAAAGTWLAA
ncbi:amidohydrolase [Mesoterricola sediminis]|uniref:Peptidase n=1 Tax=Mesoterricola sediminis TaxID=2927980 RepID=A0AA48KD65_9BACT|nr:amidohydrolase [Mesoterricola sediminis]BDU76012.1 peptidase [Mesoterricola sediminis]